MFWLPTAAWHRIRQYARRSAASLGCLFCCWTVVSALPGGYRPVVFQPMVTTERRAYCSTITAAASASRGHSQADPAYASRRLWFEMLQCVWPLVQCFHRKVEQACLAPGRASVPMGSLGEVPKPFTAGTGSYGRHKWCLSYGRHNTQL